MQKKTNHFMLLLTATAVVLTSALSTTTVHADDGTTGGTPEPVAQETAPPEEAAPTETVEEILEQVPEGTAVVVLSEGSVEPLATAEAAQIILEGDPIWCPDDVDGTPQDAPQPGSNGCTAAHYSFADLISTLDLDNGTNYSGNGTIFVSWDYVINNGSASAEDTDGSIEIFHSDLADLDNLTLQGGWDFSANTFHNADPAYQSDLGDNSLSIVWSGNVTLNNFTTAADNSIAGFYIETDGDVTLNNITSSDNPGGYGAMLDTCVYDPGLDQCTGAGDVVVYNSVFDNNRDGATPAASTHGGSGLGIDSGGTIELNNVQANGNYFAGVELYNYDLTVPGGVQIADGIFNGNGDNGLWVQSEGTIELTNTDATGNGFDGADLLNYEGSGDILVDGGDFSGNDGPGLYVLSTGSVTLYDVIANGSLYGDGAIIDNSYGTGDLQIYDSYFNDNPWTGVSAASAGDITLDNVEASNNYEAGAYLNALSGTGSIFVENGSIFNGNGGWGLKAFTKDGNILVADVFEDGDGSVYAYDTQTGAWLKSYNGDVRVEYSYFENNLYAGLLAVAGGQVDLIDITASNNSAGNGAEILSIYNFACFGTKDIQVNVMDGTYTDNPGYGLYTEAGAAGAVNFSGTQTYSNNGVDVFVNPFVNPCPKDSGKPKHDSESKPLKIVDIPEGGSEPVEQDCENFSGTLLKLHTGTSVKVGCPFNGSSQLADTPQAQLPGRLPVGFTFASAITMGLDNQGNPVSFMNEGGLLTITFTVPEELKGKRLAILYWDPTARDGQGDWIELPLDQFGGASFPLHPDDLDDGRRICSGLEQSGNKVSVTVNFPGVFALVAR